MEFVQLDKRIFEEILGGSDRRWWRNREASQRRCTELSAGGLVAEMDTRAHLLTPFENLRDWCLAAMIGYRLGALL